MGRQVRIEFPGPCITSWRAGPERARCPGPRGPADFCPDAGRGLRPRGLPSARQWLEASGWSGLAAYIGWTSRRLQWLEAGATTAQPGCESFLLCLRSAWTGESPRTPGWRFQIDQEPNLQQRLTRWARRDEFSEEVAADPTRGSAPTRGRLSAAIWKSCKSAGLKTGFCGAQIFFKSFSTALFFLGIVRRGSSGFGRVIF